MRVLQLESGMPGVELNGRKLTNCPRAAKVLPGARAPAKSASASRANDVGGGRACALPRRGGGHIGVVGGPPTVHATVAAVPSRL